MKNKKTYESRVSLGFPLDPQSWRDLPVTLSPDRLEIAGHSVMETWEHGYMKRLAAVVASKPRRILEVGFGMGISASYIQDYEVEEHVIIEANCNVYEECLAFARTSRQKVLPIFGFWQDVIPTFPDEGFSSILFDTYPLAEDEIHRNHFPFFREAHRILEKGGVLTYYSDEARRFSRPHYQALREAGFRDIRGEICPVEPPSECQYWNADTLLVPVVFK